MDDVLVPTSCKGQSDELCHGEKLTHLLIVAVVGWLSLLLLFIIDLGKAAVIFFFSLYKFEQIFVHIKGMIDTFHYIFLYGK